MKILSLTFTYVLIEDVASLFKDRLPSNNDVDFVFDPRQ